MIEECTELRLPNVANVPNLDELKVSQNSIFKHHFNMFFMRISILLIK